MAGDEDAIVALTLRPHHLFQRRPCASVLEIEPLIVAERVLLGDVDHLEFGIGPLDALEIVVAAEFRSAERIDHENAHLLISDR